MASSSDSGRLRSAFALALICVVLLVAAAHLAHAGINVWTRHGPPGGETRLLAIDPRTPATLYVGTPGALFKSTDGGSTWIGIDLDIMSGAGSLVIDPRSQTTLYVSKDGGVFKSTDGGETWHDRSPLAGQVGVLAIDPTTPTTLYAASVRIYDSSSGRIYKSTDGAGTWTDTGFGPSAGGVTALAIDPNTPAILYASTDASTTYGPAGSVFKSTDGGTTWRDTGLPLSGPVRGIAIDPKTPMTIYAGTDGGVFKSIDGGETWMGSDPLGSVTALVMDPANPTTLYVGTPYEGVFKSTDSGATWNAFNNGLNLDRGPGRGITTLAIAPTALYAGTSNGVYKSTNGGGIWELTSPRAEPVTSVVISPTTPMTVFVGTPYEGVLKSTDGGGTWTGSAQSGRYVGALAIDPATPTTIYAGTGWHEDGGLRKSTDGGGRWSNTGGFWGSVAVALAIDPKNTTTLYAVWEGVGGFGTTGGVGGLFKSTDGGGTWSDTGIPAGYVYALAIDAQSLTTVYAGTSRGVLKSTDGGGTWSNTGLEEFVQVVTALVIHPRVPTTLYAGFCDREDLCGVLKSTDGGGTWSDTGLSQSGHFTRLAIDPEASTILYAGTDGGVFKSTNSGATWGALDAGLPDTDIRALAIDPRNRTRLYAATASGLFAIDQLGACVGDCTADGHVTVDEIITMLNIALGNAQPAACPGVPGDAEVNVAWIIQAVNSALSGCGGNPPRSEACKQQDEAVQAAVDEMRRTPNAIVAVKNEACGVSLYASGNPADATTASLFLLASVTKTFVATSVLSLVKEGKLGLDDPINNWIAGLDAKYDPVTVRMLLKHTSGIFGYTEDPKLYTDPNRVWEPRELVDLAVTHDPFFTPGAGFTYSNTNYILLGMILEEVTGQKLGSVLHQHAIDRAGLTHTFFLPEEPIEGQMAAQFYPSGRRITNPFDPSFLWAAGSMVAPAADVIEWVWALYGSQTVLDPTQIQEMIDDSVVAELLPDFAESRYGQGVIIGTFTGTNSGLGVGHSGRWDGTSTDAYYFKDTGTAVVVLQNVQFWPPKVGDEAVLIGVLNALSS